MAIRDSYIAREAPVSDIELGGAAEVSHIVDESPIESTPSTHVLPTLPPPEQCNPDGETHSRDGEMQGERQGEMGTSA
jgi:hypothetical protein